MRSNNSSQDLQGLKTFQTAGGMIVELFPDAFISLQEELNHPFHAELLAKIQEQEELYVRLSIIAASVDIFLHGSYTYEQIVELCKIIVGKLRDKREGKGLIIIAASNSDLGD